MSATSKPQDEQAEAADETTKSVGEKLQPTSEKEFITEDTDATDVSDNYLPMGPRLYLIIASLMLGVFCISLDNNIVAVAIPRITNEFHNLNHVGWYGSAYLLPGCGTSTPLAISPGHKHVLIKPKGFSYSSENCIHSSA